jgi:hypothetical protein
MALTERTLDDKIEIVGEYKHLQIRSVTIIERDGVEISRGFSRRVIASLDDISNESDEIKALAALVHTDEVKAAWAAKIEEQA